MSVIVGYWSRRVSNKPDALLESLSANTPAFQPLIHSINHVGVAAIAHSGPHVQTNNTDELLRVWLTASGLPDDDGVIIEAGAQRLRLRRGAFGRVPLYWTERDGVVWFATQLQLLLPMLSEPKVSLAGLYGYACFSWVPAPLTAVEEISAVPAGSEAQFGAPHSAAVTKQHEWRATDDEISDETAAVTQLRALLDEAIARQTRDSAPDEPVGVFLSGGLDSSVTAALLLRAGMKVRAYALDFGAYGLSELPWAESVAAHLGIPLVKVDASPRRIQQSLIATARALDQPFGDGVTAPLFLLCEAAKKEVSVVYNGEGGDQLFAGWTNKPIIAAGVYAASHPAGDDFERAYLRTFHRLHGYEAAVFSEQVERAIAELDPMNWLREALDNSHHRSLLHRLRRANLMLKGAQNIQPRATNLALAHGLKVRTPFCSLPLAQWTFRLSGELCLRGPCEKYLLKRAVAEWLPEEIVWREKRGMGAPLTQWCQGPLWRELGRWLDPDSLRAEGIFQPDIALRLATGKFSGQIQGRRIGEILWLLLKWQVWRRTVFAHVESTDFSPSLYNPFWLPPRVWQWRYSTMT
jgi:asparagine synthase (glutamine-hydrolysing)